jgi:hypothetical protein
MRKHCGILGAVAALALTMGFGGGDSGAANKAGIWKPVLDDADAMTLIQRAVENIKEADKLPRPNKAAARKANNRIRVGAVMIALYAHSATGANKNADLAAYATTALQLAQAVKDSAPPAQVKKLIAELAGKPSAKGKMGPVAWSKLTDQEGVMLPMKLRSKGGDGIPPDLQTNQRLKGKGGDGIEEKIRALGRRALRPPQMKKEAKALALMAEKIAALAQLNYEFAPAKKEGKKDPQDWKQWSTDMRDQALALAAAAKKNNAPMVLAATKKLYTTCVKCHGIFKPD